MPLWCERGYWHNHSNRYLLYNIHTYTKQEHGRLYYNWKNNFYVHFGPFTRIVMLLYVTVNSVLMIVIIDIFILLELHYLLGAIFQFKRNIVK